MPQELVVLCCSHCHTYQTHISKKATKWNCKVCDQKQSIKQFFGRGTGKQCRQIVQQLNMNSNMDGMTSGAGIVNNEDYELLQQLAIIPNTDNGDNDAGSDGDHSQKLFISDFNRNRGKCCKRFKRSFDSDENETEPNR